MKKQVYNFEIYTCHPTTGETGWDIKFITVFADSKADAKEILKTVPHFDCIILTNQSDGDITKMNEYDTKAYADGQSYRFNEWIGGTWQ